MTGEQGYLPLWSGARNIVNARPSHCPLSAVQAWGFLTREIARQSVQKLRRQVLRINPRPDHASRFDVKPLIVHS